MSQPSPRSPRRWAAALVASLALGFGSLNVAAAETLPDQPPAEQTEALFAVATGQQPAPVSTPAPTPSPTPTETGEADTERTPGTMIAGDDLVLTLQLPAEVTAASATVELGDVLANPTEVAAWFDGSANLTNPRQLPHTTPDAPGSEWQATVSASALGALANGTYPVLITLKSATGTSVGTARTTIVVGERPTAEQPQALVVLPLVAPSNNGLPSATNLNDYTGANGHLTRLIEAANAHTLLAVDPALIAAAHLRAADAPNAAGWLEKLTNSPAQRFALQFADADIAAQATAGLAAPLVPSSLTGFAPGAGSGQDDAPIDPAFTDTTGLLRVPGAADGLFWPRADASTAELATIGTFAPNAVSLVASDALENQVAPADAAATVDGAPALVIDSALSRRVALAATTTDDAVRERTLFELRALLSTVPAGSRVLLALDRALWEAGEDALPAGTQLPTEAALQATLDTIADVTQPASLLELRATVGTPVTVTPASNEARAHAVTTVLTPQADIAKLSSAVIDPQLLIGAEEARALQVLATGRYPTDDALAEALAANGTRVSELLSSVKLDAPPSIQQISQKIDLPLTVTNDLPYAIKVHLKTTPEDIKLNVDPDVEVTVLPRTNTVVKVPVEARVTSAKTSITLQLQAPDGTALSPAVGVPVSVHAQWEAFGLTALGTLVGSLFLIGIIRTIRRHRRGTTDDSEPDEVASA